MATTIRVSDRTRQALERLRARLTLETGRRLSLEQTMDLLLQPEDGERDRSGEDAGRGDEKEWGKLRSLQRDWGDSVPVQDHDEIIAEDQR